MAVFGLDASRATTEQRTGTEAYAYYLIKSLIPLAEARDHHLRLYFNQPPTERLFPQSDHVEIVNIPLARLWTHVRLAWELQRRPPDLFFTPAHVIPRTYYGRSVATIHDLGYHYFPEAHPQNQLRYLKWSTQHNAKRSQKIIADSLATKADLIAKDNVPSHKIEVVYPGIDPNLHVVEDDAQITAVLNKYHIKPPYLLYIGTIHPRKNLERLIDAFVQSNVPCQLVLAGKLGWLAEPIVKKISNLQSPISNLILTDYIPDKDKAPLISGATALLYPSLHEGFGFPILEGQRCRVPVLTSTTSSCGEVAGDSALLVDPQDTHAIAEAIKQLVIDDQLCQSLIEKGLTNVQKFTWEKTAVQVMNVLEKVAE